MLLKFLGIHPAYVLVQSFSNTRHFFPIKKKIDPRDPRDQAAMIYFTKEAFAIGFGVAGHFGLETQEIDACRL